MPKHRPINQRLTATLFSRKILKGAPANIDLVQQDLESCFRCQNEQVTST